MPATTRVFVPAGRRLTIGNNNDGSTVTVSFTEDTGVWVEFPANSPTIDSPAPVYRDARGNERIA